MTTTRRWVAGSRSPAVAARRSVASLGVFKSTPRQTRREVGGFIEDSGGMTQTPGQRPAAAAFFRRTPYRLDSQGVTEPERGARRGGERAAGRSVCGGLQAAR